MNPLLPRARRMGCMTIVKTTSEKKTGIMIENPTRAISAIMKNKARMMNQTKAFVEDFFTVNSFLIIITAYSFLFLVFISF